MTTLLISLLALFILGSALLSGSETALFSLSSMQVRALDKSADPRKKLIANLLSKPRELLVTVLMLNVLMNILVQNVVSSLFGSLSGWALTVGVPLALTLVFGEVIPKSIAISQSRKISYAVAPSINLIKRFLGPVRGILSTFAGILSRFTFFYLRKEPEVSLEELRLTLVNSRDFGVLTREEAKLIRGYLDLEEHTAKELMRPRGEVISYDLSESLSKLIHYFADEKCTRIPVCNGGIEKILGIIETGEFFLNQPDIKISEDLIPHLEKPYYVPESLNSKQLLAQMQNDDQDIAMVLDEYGSIIGLITSEDLVEVVIGQIADRRDEKVLYTQASSDVIIASGKLELSEFEEIFEHRLLSETNMVTIGGWLTEKLGDIPKTGDKFSNEGFLFHVLAADPQRVRRIYVRKLSLKKIAKQTRDISS